MTYTTTILSLAGFNVIFALSVWITFAVGQFSLAQVGFWALGAYGTGMLTAIWGFPLWTAVGVSGIGCALLGVVLGYPCLRMRGFYLALATLGFSETVRVLFQNFEFQLAVDGVPTGPLGVLGFRSIPVSTTPWDVAGTILVVIALLAWLSRSRIGLAAAAVREDETVARFMGINVVMTKVGAFALASMLAGVGGGLYAGFATFVSADDFGFHMTLLGILFVAIGGTGTLFGPAVAAAVLTVLPEFFRFFAEYRLIFYGVLVIALVTWRPRGLIDLSLVSKAERLWRRKAQA